MVNSFPPQRGAFFDWSSVAKQFAARVLPTVDDPPIVFISSSIARYVSGSVRKKYRRWILRCCQILKYEFLKQLLPKNELKSRVCHLFLDFFFYLYFIVPIGDVCFKRI